MKWIIFLFFSADLQAQVYKTADRDYYDKPGSVREILPASPTKSQDGIGLCYGFTATALLEHHRCRELNLSCRNSKDLLSVLDVTSSENGNRLREGGDTFEILNNIRKNPQVAREECVPYANLVYQTTEKEGWNVLVEKWKEYKGYIKNSGNRDCVTCLADSIKNSLVNIKTPKEQLVNAFNNARSLEDFLYQALIPKNCLEASNVAQIPPFVARTYPASSRVKPTVQSVIEQVENILRSGLPAEMAICPEMFVDGKCVPNSGHSISLFGIKEMCNRSGVCKTMVKVRNSYGESWQRDHDNGWVELQSLAESSVAFTSFKNVTWIEKPGFVLNENKKVSPRGIKIPESTPASVPNEYKNHRGLWRCPGNSFKDMFEPGCVPFKS